MTGDRRMPTDGRPAAGQSERNHVTETAEVTHTQQTARKRKGAGLESLVLPELKQIASQLGLKGTAGMRKGQLIEAIQSAQSGSAGANAGQATRRGRPSKAEPASNQTTDGAQPTLPERSDRTAAVSAPTT